MSPGRRTLRIVLFAIGGAIMLFALLCAGIALYFGAFATCTDTADCKDVATVTVLMTYATLSTGIVGLGVLWVAWSMK